MVFDLPPEYEPIEKYQGTLGHKINHKFDSDSVFAPMESARYSILLPKLFWPTARTATGMDGTLSHYNFENLKPVEVSKYCIYIIWTSLKVV